MTNRLKGKVAIITGAGAGMGLAAAQLFGKEGAQVVAGDINTDTLNKGIDKITQWR